MPSSASRTIRGLAPVRCACLSSGASSAQTTLKGGASAAQVQLSGVPKGQDVNTVQFLVDDKTKVEGKLAVGAQATVEYRSNADKNIAVHVIVTATSGMSLY